MTSAIYTGTLQHVTCCACGVHYGLDGEHLRALKNSKATFFCPAGHTQYFPGKTELQRAQDEAKRERERAEMAEHSLVHARERIDRIERSCAATKGALTRTKKRIGCGVCPCCNRSFVALARHMKTKHPRFNEERAQP